MQVMLKKQVTGWFLDFVWETKIYMCSFPILQQHRSNNLTYAIFGVTVQAHILPQQQQQQQQIYHHPMLQNGVDDIDATYRTRWDVNEIVCQAVFL